MLLERALKDLENIKLGQGAFSITYDVGNGMVMKVPLEQRYADDEGKSFGLIPPLRIRKKICKDIYESTEWLRTYMPDVVTPVTMGAGGVLYQRKLKGVLYNDLADTVWDSKCISMEKRLTELNLALREIVDRADKLRDELSKSAKPNWGYIDNGFQNFMLTQDFEILGWFDPFTPSDKAIYGE